MNDSTISQRICDFFEASRTFSTDWKTQFGVRLPICSLAFFTTVANILAGATLFRPFFIALFVEITDGHFRASVNISLIHILCDCTRKDPCPRHLMTDTLVAKQQTKDTVFLLKFMTVKFMI